MKGLGLLGAAATALLVTLATSLVADAGSAVPSRPPTLGAPSAEVAPLRPLSEIGLLSVIVRPATPAPRPLPHLPGPGGPEPHPSLPDGDACAIDLKRCNQEPRTCLTAVERCPSDPCVQSVAGEPWCERFPDPADAVTIPAVPHAALP